MKSKTRRKAIGMIKNSITLDAMSDTVRDLLLGVATAVVSLILLAVIFLLLVATVKEDFKIRPPAPNYTLTQIR